MFVSIFEFLAILSIAYILYKIIGLRVVNYIHQEPKTESKIVSDLKECFKEPTPTSFDNLDDFMEKISKLYDVKSKRRVAQKNSGRKKRG